MTISKISTGGGFHATGVTTYHAEPKDRPALVQPKVFKRKVLVDGVPHYRGEKRVNGKWRYFNVAAFDNMFKPGKLLK